MTTASTLAIGIIGCGHLGRIHAETLKRIPRARVIGYADVVEAPAQKALADFGGEYATTDPHRLINDKKIDALYLCTRHDSHAPLAIASAKARKHVMIEKPMALTVQECKDIEAAVKQAEIHLMPAFKMRYYSLVRKAHELIPKPQVQFGQIIKQPWAADRWDVKPEQGGGNVLTQGCHGIDLIRFFAGSEATHVFAAGGAFTHPGHPFPDQLMASVRFADGRGASWIQGDAGAARMTGDFFWEVFADGRSVQLYNRLMHATFNDGGKVWTEQTTEEEGFLNESIDFVTSLLEGRAPATTVHDGTEATRIPLAAIESIRTGEVQRL